MIAERAAFAHGALDANRAAHQFGEFPADGEAEATAAETAGGRTVGLDEGLEQAILLLRCHTDPRIRHREGQPGAAVFQAVQRHGDDDFPRLRELDRIVHEVHQHLTQAHGITLELPGYFGADVVEEFQVLVRRPQ